MTDGPDDAEDGAASAPPSASSSASFPSMEIAWRRAEQWTKWQAERFTSFDQKAGFLIGVSGVLVGLIRTVDQPNILEVTGQSAAGIAALFAVWSLKFRGGELPGGEQLLVYAALDPKDSMGFLLNTELSFQEENGKLIERKRFWIGAAAITLVAAVALTAASTWQRWTTGGNNPPPTVVVNPKLVVNPTIGVTVTEAPVPAPSLGINVTINNEPDPKQRRREP